MKKTDPVRGICVAHEEHETAEVRDLRRNGGGRGLREGPGKKNGRGVSWTTSLRAFGINADEWTTAAHDEGEWRKRRNKGRNIS